MGRQGTTFMREFFFAACRSGEAPFVVTLEPG